MTTLDYSPIEALVFHNLSFLISSLSSNLWAWLAAVTAAVTYLWSIKAASSPPLCARLAEKNNADDDQIVITTPTLAPPSVKFTATYDDACFMMKATRKTSVVVVYEPIGGGDDDRERFYGGGDNWLCDEHVVGTTIEAETASLVTFAEANCVKEFNLESFSCRRRRRRTTIKGEDYCYDLYWKGILRMRNGDSIGRFHDSTATRLLDGNVVKYWDLGTIVSPHRVMY